MKDYKEYIEKDRGNGAFNFLITDEEVHYSYKSTVPTMRGEEPYIDYLKS